MKAALLYVVALLMTFASCQVVAPTHEWINSKYHDVGAQWGVFGGIIGFYLVVHLLGFIVEIWYKANLTKFCSSQAAYNNNYM